MTLARYRGAMRGTAPRVHAAAVAALAAWAIASCGTPAGSETPAPGTAPAGEILRAERSEVEVAGYAGAFAAEPLVLAFPAEVLLVAPRTLAALRETTGLAFLPDRGPRVLLVDGTSVPPAGRVDLRVVDGLRRPEIRIRAGAVAAREFVVEDGLPPLLVEAAVVAAARERVPPGWVREGLALHLGGALEHRAFDAVLLRPGESLDTADVAALDPGFRAAALARIAVGERPFERYLARRLAGADETSSLREVGVEREAFLEAAAATERDRTLRALAEDERLVAVRAARAHLALGDADGAEARLGSATEAPNGRIGSERRLVAAEISLARGEAAAAQAHVEQVLAADRVRVRRRDAMWLLARAAEAPGRTDDARRRLVAFARAFPDDPRTEAAARSLGLDAAALRDTVAAEPAARAAAAAALGRAAAHGSFDAVRPLLLDGQPEVRRAAAAAVGALAGNGASVATGAAADLDVACGDADASVRIAAIEALARIDRPRAEARASRLAEDPSPEVRAAATGVRAARPESAPPPPSPAK